MAPNARVPLRPASGRGGGRSNRPGEALLRRRRRRRSLRPYLLAAIGVLLAVPAVAVIALLLMVNPASFKREVEAAVLESFGRRLVIQGDITVASRLSPTLVATNISLANVAGGSRPDMLKAEEMTVELAPRALLLGRLVIARLVLLRPEILLEVDSKGEGNWRFDRGVAADGSSGIPVVRPASKVALQTLHVRDARLTLRDGRTGWSTVIGLKRLSATAATPDSPVSLGAQFTIGRQLVDMSAQTGPISRLQDANSHQPWGIFVNADFSGAKLSVVGSFTRPLEGRGYSLRVDGLVPDLSTLSWMTPFGLPQFRNLVLSGRVVDQGGAFPDISSVHIDAGNTNLEKVAPGFSLDIFRIDMPRLSEPVQVEVSGTMAGGPLRLNGSFGPLGVLLPTVAPGMVAPGDRFAVDISAAAGGATLVAKGTIASPLTQAGLDVGFAARVPDLAVLSPLVGHRLPALKAVELGGHVTDLDGSYRSGFAVSGLSLNTAAANLVGGLRVSLGERLGVRAVLDSTRFDADALGEAFAGAVGRRLGSHDEPPLVIPPLPIAPLRAGAVIPDAPVTLDALDSMDGDLRLTMAELRAGRSVFREVAGHAALEKGWLVVDKLVAQTPAGRVQMALDVDSRAEPPPIALAVTAPGLDVKSLAALFGLPQPVSGTLDIDTALQARGRTLHELAASLQGHVSAGLVDGEVDNEMLAADLGDVMQAARLGSLPTGIGRTKLRCLAVRAEAVHGVANFAGLTLETPGLLVNAAGTVNLDDETLALQLRPQLRANAAGVAPVKIEGGFRNPQFTAEPGAAGRGGAWFGERGGDACGPALSAMRASWPPISANAPAPPRRATP